MRVAPKRQWRFLVALSHCTDSQGLVVACIAANGQRPLLNHKILCLRMMHHNCRSRLLRVHVEAGGQMDADVLFRLQDGKELGLVFQIGTGWIAERVARATVLLVEEVAGSWSVISGNTQLFANVFVEKFCQCLRRLHTQAMQVEIFRKFSGIKKLFVTSEARLPMVTTDN